MEIMNIISEYFTNIIILENKIITSARNNQIKIWKKLMKCTMSIVIIIIIKLYLLGDINRIPNKYYSVIRYLYLF